MGRIISIRLSKADNERLMGKYGDDVTAVAKKLLLQGDKDPKGFISKYMTIRSNQREMARLSNENKRLWKEIRQDLEIE